MFKTKYFFGVLALFVIFGFGVAKAESDDAAVRSGLFYVLQSLQQKIADFTKQTAQVRSEEPATLMQTAYQGLPAGIAGQTLYHNGTNWVATSNLSNSGTNVSVSGGTISQTGSATANNYMASRLTIGPPWYFNLDGVQLYVNGGMRLGGGSARPTCTTSMRGVMWFSYGPNDNGPDTISACMKTASSTYIWKDL